MIELMKRAALVMTAVLALVAAPALSQETELAPEHLALARKYVDLTDKSEIFVVSLVETAMETMQTIIRQNPEIVQPVDDAITKTLESYKERKGELLDQFARVYALNFTMEELQAIVTFYESPVGQKLATANASLNDSLQRVMQVFEANLKTEFFAKVRAELKANGYDV
jgi:uncharacterized protein